MSRSALRPALGARLLVAGAGHGLTQPELDRPTSRTDRIAELRDCAKPISCRPGKVAAYVLQT